MWPLAGTVPYYGNSGPSYYITLVKTEKVRWGSEIATFRTKTLNFSHIIHLNWLAKIELKGSPGPVAVNVVVNYCGKRKMRKETRIEEKIGVFVTFCHRWHFNWRGPGLAPSPGYAYVNIIIGVSRISIICHSITNHSFYHNIIIIPSQSRVPRDKEIEIPCGIYIHKSV